MNICIVQAHRLTREVVVRALASRLYAEVTEFCCVEDLLRSSMHYDVFVVYGNLGRRMSGAKGVAQIRKQKPNALIIGVSDMPDAQAKFLASGADAFLLKAGNEIAELIGLIQGYESKELPAATPGGGRGRSV
jgi:DNA-binding NarL/FixJ family response regulator